MIETIIIINLINKEVYLILSEDSYSYVFIQDNIKETIQRKNVL